MIICRMSNSTSILILGVGPLLVKYPFQFLFRYLPLLMLTRIATFLLLLISISVQAQEFYWAKRFGGTARDAIGSSVADEFGNNYHIGYFSGSMNFTGSATVLTSMGKTDIFFTKFDGNGSLIWAKQIAGTSDEDARDLLMRSDGTLLLWARFKGTIDLDPGSGEYLLTDVGTGYNAFLANYDADGNFLWAKHFTGSADNTPYDLRLDDDGSILLSGRFTGSVDLDPDPGTTDTKTSGGGLNSYLIKLDATGGYQWGKHFYGGTGVLAQDMCLYNGSLYFVGNFQGNMKVYPENTPTMTSHGVNDLFISKFGMDGTLDTILGYGTVRNDEFSGVFVGPDGIILSGTFIDNIDIDPNPAGEEILVSNGGVDAFVLALNHDFSFKWAEHFGGTNFDLAGWIKKGPENKLFFLLKYNDVATLEVAGSSKTLTANSASATDAAILTIDPANGEVNSVWELKGPGEEYPIIFGFDNGDQLLSGAFENDVDFDYTPGGNYKLVSQGVTDCFIMRADFRVNTATHEITEIKPMSLYPNPVHAGENLHLGMEDFRGMVKMTDAIGKVILDIWVEENQIRIPGLLTPGLYHLQCTGKDGFLYNGRCLIR